MSHGVLDDIEKCMDSGWSDGLPVIPPYGSLVDPMLEALGWQGSDAPIAQAPGVHQAGLITVPRLQPPAEVLAKLAVLRVGGVWGEAGHDASCFKSKPGAVRSPHRPGRPAHRLGIWLQKIPNRAKKARF